MKEQFDKRLVDKIKDSFQQHQEPFDLQEFEKFKKLYFRRKNNGLKRIGAFWWMGIAASLIAGLILLNQFQFKDEDQNLVDLLTSNDSKTLEAPNSIESQKEDQEKSPENLTSIESDRKVQENLYKKPEHSTKTGPNKTENKSTQSRSERNLSLGPTIVGNFETTEEINTTSEKIESPIENSKPITLNKEESETEHKTLDYIKTWLGEKPELEEKQTLEKTEKQNDPVKLGVMVAPQTISNATQAMNLGAGMMSEFSFSKRLKLDVGLAYARQQMTPTSRGGDSFASVNVADGTALYNAMSSAEAARSAFAGNFINATREFSFGQLEIPINLKYKVLENKNSDIYLISGFSNMVYLNQQTTTTFSTANLAQGNFVGTQPAIQTFTQTDGPGGDSGNIDSGQMVNLGFGFEQNLKNGTFLSIEPFYKFSLGDQTFNNQQFSIGGINLRMNFQLKNKKE
jgi:hypothetical protein